MNEQLQVIEISATAVSEISMQQKAFAAEQLGPMPSWDGYNQLDQDISKEVFGKVGHIHALSAEAGRQIIEVGKTLLEIKEMLPHGQFMACVKAEFGWDRAWAGQLMQVAEYFSNVQSRIHLPSSAQVLALLASANADDATIQHVAEQKLTVKQTRQLLGNERQRERSIVQEAMSVLKSSEEARHLAAKAEHIDTRQLMDELGIRELPKGREHKTATYTFCKNGTGWWKFPIEQPVVVAVEPQTVYDDQAEVLSKVVAAQRLGKSLRRLTQDLCPGDIRKRGYPLGNGWQAEPHHAHGMCLVRMLP